MTIPTIHGEAMLMSWSETHSGGAKITLLLADPEDLEPFKAMTIKKGKVAGQRLMYALVEIGHDEKPVDPGMPSSRECEGVANDYATYGQEAQILWRSPFFRTELVWKATGTDRDFITWVKNQPCCIDVKKFGAHEGDIVPMHVRRVSLGAGTGIKPEYSVIPGCFKHHGLQTNHGESAVGGRDYYDQQRVLMLQRWAWETCRHDLGFNSMKEIPPHAIYGWATFRGVERFLPAEYKVVACHVNY